MVRNQKGQAITEAVLLMVMFFAFTFAVSQYFQREEILRQLISGPFTNLAGVIQNGVWAPPAVGAARHPSGGLRHLSLRTTDMAQ